VSAQGGYEQYIASFKLDLDREILSTGRDLKHLNRVKQSLPINEATSVTVDHLFKRPLVRLRYYSKLFKVALQVSPP